MVEMNLGEMLEHNKLWIPKSKKDDIVKKYGLLTLDDFDRIYGLNKAMGASFDNSWSTVMMAMNICHGDLKDQFDKLVWADGIQRMVLGDLLNIVSNLLRKRIEEDGIWYRVNDTPLSELMEKMEQE